MHKLNAGGLKAFCTVELQEGALTISLDGFKVFETKAGGLAVGVPANQDKTDPKKYWDDVILDQGSYFKVKDAVLAAYESGDLQEPTLLRPSKGKKSSETRSASSSEPEAGPGLNMAATAAKSASEDEDIPF